MALARAKRHRLVACTDVPVSECWAGSPADWKQSRVPSMDSGLVPGRCSPNPALLKLSALLHFTSQCRSTLLNLSEFLLLSMLLVRHNVSGILKASFFGRVCVWIIWTTLWWPIGPGILVVTKISSCKFVQQSNGAATLQLLPIHQPKKPPPLISFTVSVSQGGKEMHCIKWPFHTYLPMERPCVVPRIFELLHPHPPPSRTCGPYLGDASSE